MKSVCKMTENNLICARRQLFQVNFESNKHDMTGIVPLVELKDDKQVNYSHSNELLLRNDSICVESDDYDSDCSLGSMNSLYLKLKNRVNKKPIKNENSDPSKLTKCFKNNIITKTKNEKPIKILNTKNFYGKQKSTGQQASSKLLHLYKLKHKYTKSKIYKSKYPNWKIRKNINKLNFSFNKKQNRKRLIIQKPLTMKTIKQEKEKLIRNQLKEPVPLLYFSRKIVEKNVQNNKKYSLPNTVGIFLQNEINFMDSEPITSEDLLEINNIKNQTESNSFFGYDFIDTDDSMDSKVIDDIIESLFVEDNSFDYNKKNEL